MAVALQGIRARTERIKALVKEVEQISTSAPSFSDDLLITEDELRNASEHEKQYARATRTLAEARQELKAETAKLISGLPASVVDAMQTQGKAVHAYSVSQDRNELSYGPNAAYFENGELVVEGFEKFQDFKADFERRRRQK